MNWSEFIGTLITMFFLLILLLRPKARASSGAEKRRQQPTSGTFERDENDLDLAHEINQENEQYQILQRQTKRRERYNEMIAAEIKPKKVKKQKKLSTDQSVRTMSQKPVVEIQKQPPKPKRQMAREKLLSDLKSPQEAILLREILGPPKGLK